MFSRLSRLSLSAWIFIGLGFGVFCGIFFGELCAPLGFVGKAFIKLLQMGVLPYMVISLIHGVGSLSQSDAKIMALRGVLILGLFWLIGLAVIFGFSFAFPTSTTSSFFAVSEPRTADRVDLLDYYIPANIFDALSDNLIPAIVLFSVFLGIALLRVKNREPFLNVISTLAQALNEMTRIVIKTAPIGVFALTAAAAGTISIEQLQRLQVYFVCYILATGVLVFWMLPMLVTCFTSFRFRDVLGFAKDALALGFSTGNNFVVLAVIADKSKELFSTLDKREQRFGNVVDSVLPLAYSFPSVGKIIEILFILFVAWYVNQTLGIGKQIELAFAGVFSLFGSAKIGIPFLLDYMELPSAYFDLYMMADVVTRRFRVLLQTMSMMAITLIVTSLILRKSIFSARKILTTIFVTAILMTASIAAARLGLSIAVRDAYHEDKVLMNMEIKDRSPAGMLGDPIVNQEPLSDSSNMQEDILKRIQNRGKIRVGYDDDALPFAFYNARGELVGYDIYFAHRLAKNLGVSLDLIHLTRSQVKEYLDKGICDIVMSAFPIRLDDLGKMNFTRPYMEMKSAFVVKDFRKKDFQKQSDIKSMANLRVAVTPANSPEERRLLRSHLPNTKLVELDNIKSFFLKENCADVLLTTDKIGKAWALLHPEYGVAVPKPYLFVYDLSYPTPLTCGDHKFLEYLDHWLTLQQTSGELANQFDYWILGKTPERKIPRWSIIRNILHWVD